MCVKLRVSSDHVCVCGMYHERERIKETWGVKVRLIGGECVKTV